MRERWFLWSVLALHGCGSTAPITQPSPAPLEDYYSTQTDLRYEDHVYLTSVRTVQLFPKGFELGPPVIELGSADQLELHFDDLQDDARSLSYTIVHCDAQWRSSDLVQSIYIEGAFNDFVPAPRPSRGTRQGYLHYAIDFPTTFMRPKLSGNYLLKVYENGDEEALVLTRRFMVVEQHVLIDAAVRASRDVEQRSTAQQVDLTIRHPGFTIPDPFGDLSVVVLQNGRWDDARTGLTPRFVRNDELVYDYPQQALFSGGNEWRPLNAKSIRYAAPGIERIATDQPLAELFLAPDIKRNIRVHLDQADLNGGFLVRTDDGYDPMIEADYVWVYWQLPFGSPLAGGDVFVYGGFSDLQCKREYRCAWDEAGQRYVLRALVKQGFIDYGYAFLPARGDVPDLTALEGSHYETENDYTVLVYFNDWSVRAQRLIGLRVLNSRR